MYIHDTLKNPILGHAFEEKINFIENDYTDTRVIEGHNLLNTYFKNTFKPTKKIIKSNNKFFKNLRNTKEIYILGHSIANADIEYFKEIYSNISTNTIWFVNYRSINSKNELKKSLLNLGINIKKIHFIKL